MSELVPDRTTELEYFCLFVSSYCVLSDQATIVGVSFNERTTIIKENITDHSVPVVAYTANIGEVFTLAVDEASNVLLAGSKNSGHGQVVQYDLSTGQAIKNYGQVGIGNVLSSTRVENLWLFGGCEFKITAIDSVRRRVVHTPVATAFRYIYSMTVYNLKNAKQKSQVLLLVDGNRPNYSKSRFFVFDISRLVNKYAVSPSIFTRAICTRSKHNKHG